jgi:endonuclease/exonuclease/phosphatase family metal-dependent hydrolase
MKVFGAMCALILTSGIQFPCFGFAPDSGPQVLTFPELVSLAVDDPVPPALETKLNTLLSTPFIHNDSGVPAAQDSSSLHVAEWNINRGENEDEVLLALANEQGYLSQVRNRARLDAKQLSALSDQLHELQRADIVVLDEVDYGVKRTKYRNVARDISNALGMNYAYAVEFVELNRIYLGSKKSSLKGTVNTPKQDIDVDRDRYLGLEGSAILSRYPILSARIVRLPVEYDWYHAELKALSDIERVRRWTAQRVFNEEIKRQIRRGGRMALVVELQVSNSPGGIVTVVCPHLEDYCGEKGRRRQLDALLPEIAGIRNPVILAGDMNTVGHNGRPLTPRRALRRYLLNYRVWAREVLYLVLPIPAAGELFRVANYIKNLHDPTAFSVPLVLRNPSRAFFKHLSAFRFQDGGRFSFDGDRSRSFGGKGSTLANSNQRATKGFATTFSFNRTFGGLFGIYKIDWFFVKEPPATSTSRFKPGFGRTLDLVNTALEQRISDHAPIAVTVVTSVNP